MAGKLFDHAQAEDRAFRCVVENMQTDQAGVEITIGGSDIFIRFRFRHPITMMLTRDAREGIRIDLAANGHSEHDDGALVSKAADLVVPFGGEDRNDRHHHSENRTYRDPSPGRSMGLRDDFYRFHVAESRAVAAAVLPSFKLNPSGSTEER